MGQYVVAMGNDSDEVMSRLDERSKNDRLRIR